MRFGLQGFRGSGLKRLAMSANQFIENCASVVRRDFGRIAPLSPEKIFFF
jgi:hypothetical protein